jgi:CubicO group peptidase (beta-lactamase class C family)
MGPRSYGHTGFTGTSIWIDPDARLFVILLTNRVYPTRDNSKHTKVRSDIADLAFRAIVGPPQPILPSITHE